MEDNNARIALKTPSDKTGKLITNLRSMLVKWYSEIYRYNRDQASKGAQQTKLFINKMLKNRFKL